MADGGDRLLLLREVAHDPQHPRIEPQILRRPAARDDQRVVALGPHVVESGVEREVVARLFAVGLVALEVVDGGANLLAGLLVGADRVHAMADHQQRLERHHRLVVLDEIADEHQDFLRGHVCTGGWKSGCADSIRGDAVRRLCAVPPPLQRRERLGGARA